MTDVSLLKVSLTKHNAHKVAQLLKDYKVDQVLDRLDEVHAEKAQTYKNLSVLPGNRLPQVWTKAKKAGRDAIDALVLVGIIFSHHELIRAMAHADDRSGFAGRITRGRPLGGKAYTNFARVMDQLGFTRSLDQQGITFDLRRMFKISGLGSLVAELLGHKLDDAGWDRKGSVPTEAIKQKFHKVFGIPASEFRQWLTVGTQPAAADSSFLPKDEEFFQATNERENPKPFKFKPGHTERAVGPINKAASERTKASQLHNDIQNRLYNHLCAEVGAKCVGTELNTGVGTTIDVVVKQKNRTTFFEIKTSDSVRTNIRQAIPQLLEYAYWPDSKRADELVIVSHLRITTRAGRYLEYLHKQFNLPLRYRQFDLKKNVLI